MVFRSEGLKPTRCKEKRERINRYPHYAEDIAICLDKCRNVLIHLNKIEKKLEIEVSLKIRKKHE